MTNIWTLMSKRAQVLTGTLIGAAALVGSFATIGGGLESADRLIEEAITTEAEHNHDIETILTEILRKEVQGEINLLSEQKLRNIREIDRLDRDLAGGKFNNENEKASMLRSLDRNERGIEKLDVQISDLQDQLDTIKPH